MAQGQNEKREAYLERRKQNHLLNADKERAYRKQAADKICETTREWQKTVNGVFATAYAYQCRNSLKRGHAKPDYTVDQLKEKFLNDDFVKLHDAWVQSGHDKDLKPSFDRIDSNLGYTLGNLQLMTKAENNAKGYVENRLKTAIPIMVYDSVTGELVAEYPSAIEASAATGVYKTDISSRSNGSKKQTGKYIFKKKEGFERRRGDVRIQLEKLMNLALDTHGFYCNQMAFNSGFVINIPADEIFPRFDGFEPMVKYNAFNIAVAEISKKLGLNQVTFKTKEAKSKIHYKDVHLMAQNVRALSVLDKALNEFMSSQPEG